MDKDSDFREFLSQEKKGTKREKIERLVKRVTDGIGLSPYLTPTKPNTSRRVSLSPTSTEEGQVNLSPTTTTEEAQVTQAEEEEDSWPIDD